LSAAPRVRARRRRLLGSAVLAALAVHVLLLGAMGVEQPRSPALPIGPDEPTVEIQLPPRLDLRGAAGTPVPGIRPAEGADNLQSPLAGLATPQERVQLRPGQAVTPPLPHFPGFYAGGLPGCGREDMILLTVSERVSCAIRIAEAQARAQRGEPPPPGFDPFAGMSPSLRAALDAEVARRNDPRRPAPVTPCKGRFANLGAGCLPDPRAGP